MQGKCVSGWLFANYHAGYDPLRWYGAGIKAITGGDKVAIDPKHKPPIQRVFRQ